MARVTSVSSTRFGEQWEVCFELSSGLAGRTMRALVHRPFDFTPASPVVVVMHGVTRAVDQYMSSWMGLAERLGFLLIVPEFSRQSWPTGRSYNLGNMRHADGSLRPRDEWSFTVLNDVISHAQRVAASQSRQFLLYGHSAGAQFVHRYVLFAADQRLSAAVCANAGWYTLPTAQQSFPYGLGGMPLAQGRLRCALQIPLTVMVGTEDTDASDPDLRRSPRALAQGPNRLARARTFYASATAAAAELGASCAWRYLEVPDVGHNDRDLAAIAARMLVGGSAAGTLHASNHDSHGTAPDRAVTPSA